MKAFAQFHPFVNGIYFLFVILFSMFFMHPICLTISLSSAFIYSVLLSGRKAVRFNLLYMLPMAIFAALLNPAFNHEGITILGYLPGGNPLTLESIFYGLAAAVMLCAVICWFSCFNQIMTSDKFVYIFGRISPALSLVLSMVLRFVPKFKAQIHAISMAQKGIGRDVSKGNLKSRIKAGLSILSAEMTLALENAIETADSMKSRGFGRKGRTAYSIFKFEMRDKIVLGLILFFGIYTGVGWANSAIQIRYFPDVETADFSIYAASVYLIYAGLCLLPVCIEIVEDRRWKKALKLSN